MMDRARKQTDRKLKEMERDISRVYTKDPALLQIRRKYERYMKEVQRKTKDEYEAFVNETDPEKKKELKNAYVTVLKALTSDSKQYRDIIKHFTAIMAEINQKALDIVNDNMIDIYALNYNQVAEDCRKVGIRVNGL